MASTIEPDAVGKRLWRERPVVERAQLHTFGRQMIVDSGSRLIFAAAVLLVMLALSPPQIRPSIDAIWIWIVLFAAWSPVLRHVGKRLSRTSPRTLDLSYWRPVAATVYGVGALSWVGLLAITWPVSHGDTVADQNATLTVEAFLILVLIAHMTTYLVNLSTHMTTFAVASITAGVGGILVVVSHDSSLSQTGIIIFAAFGLAILWLGRGANRRLGSSMRRAVDLEQLAASLALARNEAEYEKRRRDRFFGSMSHELRTPLNAIIGFSDIMESGMFGPIRNPLYRGYVEDIRASGSHLLELVNEVLDLSAIEDRRLALRRRWIRPSELMADIRPVLTPLAEAKSIDLLLAGPDDVVVLADPLRIKQVLLNLGGNAVKFTPPGGQIQVRCRAELDTMLVITVADTGIGIAQDDLDRVFDPFGQARIVRTAGSPDPATAVTAVTGASSGSGLGLTIARELVELHEGSLRLSSSPGIGTVATVTLPNLRAVAGDDDEREDPGKAVALRDGGEER